MSIINNILNHSDVSVLKVVEIDKQYIIDIKGQQWSITENKCIKYKSGFPTKDVYNIKLKDFFNRFVLCNSNVPTNHYKNWTNHDYAVLGDFISENYILFEAAEDLNRTPESVFNKILEKKLLKPYKNFERYKVEFDNLNFNDIFYEEKIIMEEYLDSLNNFKLPI